MEKPIGDGGWINGGFFVLNKKLLTISKMKKRYGKRAINKSRKEKSIS